MVVFLKILNFLNMASMFLFLPEIFGLTLLEIEGGDPGDNLILNQIAAILIFNIVICLCTRIMGVKRTLVPSEIFTGCGRTVRITAIILFFTSYAASLVLHFVSLKMAYIPQQLGLVLLIQMLGIMNCGMEIRKLQEIKEKNKGRRC